MLCMQSEEEAVQRPQVKVGQVGARFGRLVSKGLGRGTEIRSRKEKHCTQ
jgi:hypothetical protein